MCLYFLRKVRKEREGGWGGVEDIVPLNRINILQHSIVSFLFVSAGKSR